MEMTNKKSSAQVKETEHIEKIYNRMTEQHDEVLPSGEKRVTESIKKIYGRLTEVRGITRLSEKTGKSRKYIYDCFKNKWTIESAMKIYKAAVEVIKAIEAEKQVDIDKKADELAELAELV